MALSAYYFGGKLLRNLIIDQLNDQLNVHAKVYSIHLDGLSTFPRIGIQLTNVRVNESTAHYEKYLLQARKLKVVVNPFTFVTGKNEIERIELDQGAIRLYTDQHGTTNFDIFKPQEETSDEALNVDLKKVMLTDFQCVYVNKREDQSFNFKTDALAFSGKFDEEKFELRTNGDALFDHLMLGGTDYIMGKYTHFDLVLDVNQKIESYHIAKGSIGLDDLSVDVQGDVLMAGDEPNLDLKLTGTNIDVQSILSVLPNDIHYGLRELESKGNIEIDGRVTGSFTESSWPEIDIHYAFDNASIRWPEKDLTVEKINLKGGISNLNSKSSTQLRMKVDVEDIQLPKSSIKGDLLVKDFNNVEVAYELKGVLDATDIEGLIIENDEEHVFGRLLFNLKGELGTDDAGDLDFAHSVVNGDLELRDLNYLDDEDKFIEKLTAKTRVKGNDLTRAEVAGVLWQNHCDFKGVFKNWQGFLFSDQRLGIEGDIKSKFINLNFESDTTATTDNETPEPISIDFAFDADVNLQADTFTWSMISASKLSGHLTWTRDQLIFKNLAFDAWSGHNQLDGEFLQTADEFILTSTSYSENVSIGRLLDEFDNFGQTEFTSEIMQGDVTTTVDLTVVFDRYFEVKEDQVRCLAEVDITDGRLKDYQPMESLSSFVELEDLQDIRFEALHNTIEIGERTIQIPTMEIKNNALNLEIGGSHNFDNYMDYHMKIRVSELLAKNAGWIKRKKEREIEDDGRGSISAYIVMRGTPDDLKIRYDRKAVKQVVKQEVKRELKDFFKEVKKEVRRKKSPTEDRKKVEWDE
ncbi:MAG: hypothetical protein JJ975_02085 [Bacteroidia bacterium]|nr:hypothetical protein [Bacteroidia bacterium]